MTKMIPITIRVSRSVPEVVWRAVIEDLGRLQKRAMGLAIATDWKCTYRHAKGTFNVAQNDRLFLIWADNDRKEFIDTYVRIEATADVVFPKNLN